jgi:hypothetical protein
MVPTKNEICDAAYSSLDQCKPLWSNLTEDGLVTRFIESEKRIGLIHHYKSFSDIGREIIESVRVKYGEDALRPFMRIVLLKAVIGLVNGDEIASLPRIVASDQRRHLLRIALDSDTSSDWLNISHDLFHKEFGLASLRLFAAGAQLIDVRCGVPRSMLFKNGLWGLPNLAYAFARLGGFKPYFEIHTHIFNLERFNEEGWADCYRACAALYDVFPRSLGMFGASWFYDPAIEQISPRLSYLRKTPLAGKAMILYCDTGESAKANALSTSSSRRALYEAGKYTPKNYMLIWGKSDQIAWSRSHSGIA